MNLENIKWIATDIDGTLKPYDREFNPVSRDRLLQLINKGVNVSAITGRPIHGALHYAKVYGLQKTPIVACNGALIYDQGKIVYRHAMDIEPLMPFVEQADELGASILLTSEKTEYCYKETEWILKTRKERDPFPFWKVNENKESIYKLAIMGHESDDFGYLLRTMFSKLNNSYEIVLYGNSGSEITAKSVNKANGLRHLAEYLDLSIGEIAVIGDNENDIAMLQAAGIGIAVANAQTKVKNVADYVCEHASTDGVIEFIEKVREAKIGIKL